MFPGFIGDPGWGCDPYPDGNTVGPVISPAAPWIDEYVALNQPKPGFRQGLDYLLEPNALQRGCRTFWHIEAFALERLYERAEAEELFSSQDPTAQLGGLINAHPVSQLKLLIEWPSARQERRFLVADIGTGLDVTIGPTTRPTAVILQPVQDAETLFPFPFEDLETQVTATLVTARATPLPGSRGPSFNARYTQSLLVPAGETDPIFHRIPRFARAVQAYTQPLTGTLTVPGTTMDLFWVNDFLLPGGAPAIPLGFAGQIGLPTPPYADNFDIPQNAKFVAVQPRAAVGDNARIVTLVYTLSV